VIPREILKNIRQIELRTSRSVTNTPADPANMKTRTINREIRQIRENRKDIFDFPSFVYFAWFAVHFFGFTL
jgi:hypothetical protein